jgi:hypothetical protein
VFYGVRQIHEGSRGSGSIEFALIRRNHSDHSDSFSFDTVPILPGLVLAALPTGSTRQHPEHRIDCIEAAQRAPPHTIHEISPATFLLHSRNGGRSRAQLVSPRAA